MIYSNRETRLEKGDLLDLRETRGIGTMPEFDSQCADLENIAGLDWGGPAQNHKSQPDQVRFFINLPVL